MWLWAAIALALTCIALPVLMQSFAQNDDYYLFAYDSRFKFGRHPQHQFFNLVGRQLYNVVQFVLVMPVRSLASMVWLRIDHIVALSAAGALIASSLCMLGIRPLAAGLAALALLTLPGLQMPLIWTTMVPFSAALLLALGAGRLVATFDVDQNWSLPLIARRTGLAVLVLLLALFIYQPWAMFVLLPPALRLAAIKEASVLSVVRRIGMTAATYVISTAIYFGFHNFVFLPLYFRLRPEARAAYETLASFRFEFTSDLADRVVTAGLTNVRDGLLLWDIAGQGWGLAIGLLALAACLLLPARHGWRGIAAAIGMIGFMAASLVPVVVSAAGAGGLRTVVPFSAIVLGCGVTAVLRLLPPLPATAVAGVAALSGAALIMPILYASAMNSVVEIGYIRSALARAIEAGPLPKRVHVIECDPSPSFLGKPLLGSVEFNVNSSGGWMNIPWMIRSQLKQMMSKKEMPRVDYRQDPQAEPLRPDELIVTTSPFNKPLPSLREGTLVIDMPAARRASAAQWQ